MHSLKLFSLSTRYPFVQVLAGHLNASQSEEVWNPRRAPKPQAKEDHSTEAWPQFREVQQYTLITAMEMGKPGIWSLVLGLLSTERISK